MNTVNAEKISVLRTLQLAACLFCLSCSPAPVEEAKSVGDPKAGVPRQATTWKVGQGEVESLASEVAIQNYRIRPPKGYRSVPPKGESKNRDIFVWAGPKREGRLGTTLVVIVFTMDEKYRLPQNLRAKKQFVKAYNSGALSGYKKGNERMLRLEGFKQLPAEEGIISGIPFVRIRWSARSGLVNSELKGFYYVGEDDNKIITINSYDSDSEVLKVREASVLTFRRAGTGER